MHHSFSDSELVNLIKSGESEAFDEAYRRYWPAMYRSAFAVLRDHENCMDIVQDIFLWLWNNRETLIVSSLSGYLISAVKYKAANYIRQGKVRTEFFGRVARVELREPSLEDQLEVRELQQVIELFIEKLPDRWKEVFLLSRKEHLSNREIAKKLDITEKTVEKHITSSLKRIRISLSRLMSILLF